MSTTRAAITISDEDYAFTLLKPYSGAYDDMLIVVYEDAYGEMTGKLQSKFAIQKELNLTDEEFDKILQKLL